MSVAAPLRFRPLEDAVRRALGALRFVDANTGALLREPLDVVVAGARLRRNRSGLWVISDVAALQAHGAAFDAPPALPAPGSITLQLQVGDPSGRYLPRSATLALPRDAALANAGLPGSLFRAIDLAMFPSPAAPTSANWALLRVSVVEAASGDALGGALLRVTRNGDTLARALSDWRGEALVPVPGVPVTTWSAGPGAVVVSEVAANLDVVFDAALGSRLPMAGVRAGTPPQQLPVVDPDDLNARRAALPGALRAVQLAAGRATSLFLPLALP